MKMETNIPSPVSGVVTRVTVNAGDNVEGDDLLIVVGEGSADTNENFKKFAQ